MYSSANYIYDFVYYAPNNYLSYSSKFVPLYLLTVFIQFLLLLSSGNHKYDLFL